MAAASGAKGDSPAAIKSALMNVGQLASLGKNSRAKVVLPAPLGPAMMTIFLSDLVKRCLWFLFGVHRDRIMFYKLPSSAWR